VTKHFTDIRTVDGELVVDPQPLTVWTASAEKVYDGTPLTADARLVGLKKGADATVKATGTITHAGSTKNTYEIVWGDTDPNDYTITEDFGTLTVEKATLYVSTGYAHKFYDGKPLTCDEAELTGLQNGETAWVTATGTITDIGYTENTYKLTWGTANPDNYKIEEYLGWLGIYDPDDPEIPDEEPLLSSPENALEAGPKPDAKKESDAAKDSKTEKGSKAENESNVNDGSKDEKDSKAEDESKAEKSSDTDRDSKAEMKAGTDTSSGAEAGKNPEAEMNSGSETRSETEKSSET
jgi:hypothetical protein